MCNSKKQKTGSTPNIHQCGRRQINYVIEGDTTKQDKLRTHGCRTTVCALQGGRGVSAGGRGQRGDKR